MRKCAIARVEHANNNERGNGNNDEGVNENTDECDRALFMRVLHIRLCVSVRSRTHAGLIGEETALCTLSECCQDTEGHTTDLCLWIERAREDERERLASSRKVAEQNDKAADQIDDGHDRNDLLGNDSQTTDAADEDIARDRYDGDAPYPRRDAECSFAGRSDRVRLNHTAHEAERQDDGDREETGWERAELAAKCGLDVVDGTAMNRAVGIDKRCFCASTASA